MNKKEIKLPFTCNQLGHSIGITYTVFILFFDVIPVLIKGEFYYYPAMILIIFYPMVFVIFRMADEKPILPFKFTCRCG